MAKPGFELRLSGHFLHNNQASQGGGCVERWCWVNFQCRAVLLIWIIVGPWPTSLAVGAGGGCLNIFSLLCHFLSFSLSLGDSPL